MRYDPLANRHNLAVFSTFFGHILVETSRTAQACLNCRDAYSDPRPTDYYTFVLLLQFGGHLLGEVRVMAGSVGMGAYILDFYVFVLFGDVLLDELF